MTKISRRQFVYKTSAGLSAAIIAVPGASFLRPRKYKMGLQLYTIRDAMERDVQGTIKRIAAMGYQDLETYGYNNDDNKYYGFFAKDFRQLLTDHGLSTSSGHYDLFQFVDSPLGNLDRYVDQCITGAHALGQRYITWPWLPPEHRSLETFKALVGRLNRVGERITKAGLGFAYHNHDFEFIQSDGETGYEIIMRETDPALVKLQIDLYWVMHSAQLTPSQLFAAQPGRFVMWHIKDMHKVSRDYTELGNGSIDYALILPEAIRAGMEYYFIEQGGNFAKDSMQSVADSAAFFKRKLAKYI